MSTPVSARVGRDRAVAAAPAREARAAGVVACAAGAVARAVGGVACVVESAATVLVRAGGAGAGDAAEARTTTVPCMNWWIWQMYAYLPGSVNV